MNESIISVEEYLEVVETLHSLAREAIVLERLIATRLSGRQRLRMDDTSTPMEFIRDETLSSILRRRVLAEGLSPDDAADIIQIACGGLDRFRLQVQNFLGSLARQDELNPVHKRVDIKSIVHSAAELLKGAAMEKGIEILFDHDDDGFVLGDRDLLFRALFNILDNAIKYSYPLTEQTRERFVTIDSRRHTVQGDWLIAMKSYGVGIDRDEIESGAIFRYGFRGRRSADRGRTGTGVGLAEARRIVLAHRGEINVDSKPLEVAYVTTVKVVIPTSS